MSRTRQTSGSSSPVKKYLSFAGSGKIKFFDKDNKDADDKGNVYLDKLDFVIVDVKASVSGYNEKASSGINSNYLDPYDTGKEIFTVKTKVNGTYGEFSKGIWKDIKDEVSSIGGKFTTNVFAIADVGDGDELVRLELKGASLTPWIDFTKDMKDEEVYDYSFTLSKGQLCTRHKGKTVAVSDAEYKKVMAALKKDPMYQKPVWFYASAFTNSEATEEVITVATDADGLLQEYFDGLGVNKSDDSESTTAINPEPAEVEDEGEIDDLPF